MSDKIYGIELETIEKLADIVKEKDLSEITINDMGKVITIKGKKCPPPPPPPTGGMAPMPMPPVQLTASAAGAVEAIVTALSVQNDYVHVTRGYKVPDPECDLDYCTEGGRNMTVNAALSNSLGFGGHNATICIKKYKD